MRDTILIAVIIASACYAVMYSISRGADIEHCQAHGLSHAYTDYKLSGYCTVHPAIVVPAWSLEDKTDGR